ncbi:hypothetical protein K525DRAFT_256985, partial [Schizophyllum commune Loenen D]
MSEGAAGICIDVLCGVFGGICLDFASVRASFAHRRTHPPHQTLHSQDTPSPRTAADALLANVAVARRSTQM